MLEDLLSKAKLLRAPARSAVIAAAIATFLPDGARARLEYATKLPPIASDKESVDVAFVVVIPPELVAMLYALEIDPKTQPTQIEEGTRIWQTSVTNTASGEDANLKVIVAMVGEAGNVSCATTMGRLFGLYDIGLAVLCGVAGGLRGKVQLGDVVAADLVLDYEYARLELEGPARRPRPFTLRRRVARDLQHFDPLRMGWLSNLRGRLSTLRRDPFVRIPAGANESWEPACVRGVILSGEKVIADGSLEQRRREMHDRIRAAEMEGAGFARACEEQDVPWLVFRGVSDYGDETKPADDEWHVMSSLAAATAAVTFVRTSYTAMKDVF